jgi:DNA-binding XRE family transcriptional regulator
MPLYETLNVNCERFSGFLSISAQTGAVLSRPSDGGAAYVRISTEFSSSTSPKTVPKKGSRTKMTDKRLVSPAQCRAARALLGWTQAALAERSGVARKTIADFELDQRTLQMRTRRDITGAFIAAGIEFVWDDDDGKSPKGEGLRFARKAGSK